MFIRYKSSGRGKSVPVARVYTENEHPVRSSMIDKDALWAVKKIQQSGAEAYIVGGAIRDIMLGRKPKDFDIATSLSPRQVQRLFWNSRIIGRRFRIVHLFFSGKIIEVTTFRSDEENFEDGKNNVYGTIEQDARRRDFSINSLYYDPSNGQILDFNDAFPDFRKKTIRSLIPLSYTFSEDPVRMIRALKYQATTGFSMKRDVRKAIKRDAENISHCSISRLTEEMGKIFTSGNSLPILLNLQKYGLLAHIMPCLSMYLAYPEIKEALSEIDAKVKEGIEKGEPFVREEIFRILIKPVISFPEEHDMNVDELFHDAFRQAKILVSPLTPPNYELEKAVSLVLEDMGIRKTKPKKSAEARVHRKKPNTMGRKSAANEELSTVPHSKRKRKRRKHMEKSVQPKPAMTMAEEHDL